MKFVLDSNLLISAWNENDIHHAEAVDVFRRIKEMGAEIIAPVLQLWEIDAYLRHVERSKKHKNNVDLEVKITHYDVTSGLYTRTYCSEMACVKGADRVFVSLAKDHNVPLITNDQQILRYSSTFNIKAMTAQDFVGGKF